MHTFSAEIEYSCQTCGSHQKYRTNLPGAECYSNPEEAKIRITCWCKRCRAGNALDVKIEAGDKFTLIDMLDYSEVAQVTENSSFPVQVKKKDDELSNEDLALQYFSNNTNN